MWPTFCARYGPWFFLFLVIQSHLAHSDAINYEDLDENGDDNLADSRRAYNGGYANSRSNQPQCPSVVPCQLLAGSLKAIRNAVAELESINAAYCGSQHGQSRFQPMNFPPFPSMDFMQFPPFPPFMSPPNNPVPNPPPNNPPLTNPPSNYPPPNYVPPVDQQRPHPPSQQETDKLPPDENPWNIFTGLGSQSHKKIKVKICNSRRSGNGKKKHAAAAAPIQKPTEEEKEDTTTESNIESKSEDETRGVPSTAPEVPSTTVSYQEPAVNGDKKEKID